MSKTYRTSPALDSRLFDDVCLLAEILVSKDWTPEEEKQICEHFRKTESYFKTKYKV